MKKLEIKDEKKKIDWDESQWLQSNDDLDQIVLTTGEHTSAWFWGMMLPCKLWPTGNYTEWAKSAFHLLTTDIPFIISNND